MSSSSPPLIEKLRRWHAAAATAPQLVGAGAASIGFSASRILLREGPVALHWKVLGDSLVRSLRRGGPLFTKLGQILATRADLLPAEVCGRLEELYASQPAMSSAQLKRCLRRAYPRGRPFASFERRPIAVGSVAQVHRASLTDGAAVVVKVVRPGTAEAIERNVYALRAFADLYFALSSQASAIRSLATKALEDLAGELEREANLENEAQALEEFRRQNRNPQVYIPLCYREWSSREVLVLEELHGEPLSVVRDKSATDPAAAKKIAQVALKEIVSQVFEHGRFHADPHAGNFLLLPDGRLGLIDLGLTGSLGPAERKRLIRAAKAFLARDPDQVIRSLMEFGTVSEDFDLEAFQRDVRTTAGRYGRRSIAMPQGSGLDELVHELLLVAHRHHIYLPPSTTLLIKAIVTIEGVARSLDPELNVASTALPVVLRSLTPRFLRWDFWRTGPQ